MKVNIYDYYHQISSRRDFVKFLKLLYDDYQENIDKWENDNLDRFLEGLYASNQNTTDKENDESPSWKLFADLLLTAKVYE